MNERSGMITLRGNPVTLVGNEVGTGDKAPDFQVVNNDLEPVTLEDYLGKIVVLVTVPSLDTPICDMETRRFNSEAAAFSDQVVILTISTDLPFAQKRWCGAAGVDRVITLSDHRQTSFGLAYGVLIKEVRLLARSIFIVDRDGTIAYSQLVPEVGSEPDYDEPLAAIRGLL